MSALITELAVPFGYGYMLKAMWVSALVGGVCAFLSAYLMLKGWSLMGDALGHAIVPGVAVAYIIGAPFAVGAFFAGILASIGMNFVKQKSRVREDAVIGLVFTTMFALGLLLASIWPTSVSIQTIVLGNILAISNEDVVQVAIIAAVSLIVMVFIQTMQLQFQLNLVGNAIGIRCRDTDRLQINSRLQKGSNPPLNLRGTVQQLDNTSAPREK